MDEIHTSKYISYKWIIIIAIFIHTVWGFIIFRSPMAMDTTPAYALSLIINNNTVLGLVLIGISILAFFGYTQKKYSTIKYIILLLPQQISLLLSAFGAIYMILSGHYADGVMRSPDFMLVDQLPIIAIALAHFLAVFEDQGQWLIDKVKSLWEAV